MPHPDPNCTVCAQYNRDQEDIVRNRVKEEILARAWLFKETDMFPDHFISGMESAADFIPYQKERRVEEIVARWKKETGQM